MASVTELWSYLIVLFLGDFVSSMGRAFDSASARSTGLRWVSGGVILGVSSELEVFWCSELV